MASVRLVARLLTELDKVRAASVCISIADATVKIESLDTAMCDWVQSYLHPWPRALDNTTVPVYRVSCLYSDELVADGIRLFAKHADSRPIQGYEKRRFVRKKLDQQLDLYLDVKEGLLWLFDREASHVLLVYASRTRWPSLELARTSREVLCRTLENQQWVKYHAAAIDTASGTLLIMGDGGSGKTTLLLEMIVNGGRFIGNERVYIRRGSDRLQVTGIPMAIAIGLGSALQFPEIERLIYNYGELKYRQRRLDVARLKKTDRSDWANSPAKLQLLPAELTSALNAGPAIALADLVGIVVPELDEYSVEPTISSMNNRDLANVIDNNILTGDIDSLYPDWAKLADRALPDRQPADDPGADYTRALGNLPAVKATYYLDRTNTTSENNLSSRIVRSFKQDK